MQEGSRASAIQSADRHPEDDMSDDPTGREFDAIELVVSTKWRDSGCLFLVAPAKAAAQGYRRCARRHLFQPGASSGCPLSPA